MAYFDNKTSLVQLNPLLDLSFSHICTAVFDYHITTTFPVNVLVLILNDDGSKKNFFDVPLAHRKMPLLKDHVYFVPCGMEIKIDITPGITTLAFHFNLTFFHGLDIFSGTSHCEMYYDPDFIVRMQALVNDEKDDLKAACALKAEVMRFCLPFWPENAIQMLPIIQKYEPIFHYIHEYGNAELTVSSLAKQAGQRQDVFSRAFKRDIGKPPKEFLQNDLLRKITSYLLRPHVSVKETAAKLKFSSEFYMSYFFKKHTGLSPSDYQHKFRVENSYVATPNHI